MLYKKLLQLSLSVRNLAERFKLLPTLKLLWEFRLSLLYASILATIFYLLVNEELPALLNYLVSHRLHYVVSR